jgi:hypothetical protein
VSEALREALVYRAAPRSVLVMSDELAASSARTVLAVRPDIEVINVSALFDVKGAETLASRRPELTALIRASLLRGELDAPGGLEADRRADHRAARASFRHLHPVPTVGAGADKQCLRLRPVDLINPRAERNGHVRFDDIIGRRVRRRSARPKHGSRCQRRQERPQFH